jgi:hypothetical protein
MKKSFFLTAFVTAAICINSFAQVTKLDFETSMTKAGVTKFDNVYLQNQKTFYTDGTSKYTYNTYTGDKTKVELTATSIFIYYYTDNKKATVSGITVIPFSSVKSYVMSKELTIDLKE